MSVLNLMILVRLKVEKSVISDRINAGHLALTYLGFGTMNSVHFRQNQRTHLREKNVDIFKTKQTSL